MTTIDHPSPANRELPAPHRFTRDEYYQMADAGYFQDQRVELIAGEIIDMAPQKSTHFSTIEAVVDALKSVFGPGYWVRAQGPLHLAPHSAPEPDVAVTTGSRKTHTDHPSTALLVVEVSDSTLRFDRKEKASFYAHVGITDYWIVNLQGRCLEVYRDPAPDPDAPFGHRYQSLSTLKPSESVSPLAAPAAQIPVADLLP